MVPALLSFVAPALAGLIGMAREAPVLPLVEWEELVAHSHEEIGRTVRVFVQVEGRVETWEPYLTRFTPQTYLGVRGWSDAQMPWLEVDYRHPRVHLFARRDRAVARRFEAARPHDRLTVACVVRGIFAGRVWVEALGARPTRESVPEGTVLHAEKALDLLRREAPGMAREQLERALAAPLPRRAREALEALRDRIRV